MVLRPQRRNRGQPLRRRPRRVHPSPLHSRRHRDLPSRSPALRDALALEWVRVHAGRPGDAGCRLMIRMVTANRSDGAAAVNHPRRRRRPLRARVLSVSTVRVAVTHGELPMTAARTRAAPLLSILKRSACTCTSPGPPRTPEGEGAYAATSCSPAGGGRGQRSQRAARFSAMRFARATALAAASSSGTPTPSPR